MWVVYTIAYSIAFVGLFRFYPARSPPHLPTELSSRLLN